MRKANDLSHEEAVGIVGRIIDAMYLDADVESEFYDPEKSIDGADFVEAAATILADYGLVPEEIERLV